MKQGTSKKSAQHGRKRALLMLEPPAPIKYVAVPSAEPSQRETADEALESWEQETHPSWWQKWRLAIGSCAIVCLGIFLYAYTLNFPFQFDDHIYLVGNPFITQMKAFVFETSFKDLALHSYKLGQGFDPSVNFILRPVSYFSFHLNYLVDGFQPRGFRLMNIAIHCANAALLFFLLDHLIRKSPKAAHLSEGSRFFIPLVASLLFIAHPLHTESVTYIVQRFTSLVAFFTLAALCLHLLSLTASTRASALLLRIVSVVATILGMLTKECMFTMPLLFVLVHMMVLGGTLRRACWQALPHLLCMLILPALVLITSHVQSGNSDIGHAMQIASSSKDPTYRYHYFVTQLGIILEYVRLIVWPQGLNVDREYMMAQSFHQLRVWLSAVVILFFLVLGWRLGRSQGIRRSLIGLGIFWYFLSLAVTSSVIPLDDLIVDHRTYTASMGVMILGACAFDLLRTKPHRWAGMRWSTPVGAAACIALLATATVTRNDVWRSEATLWADTVMKSPNKARPWDNLGVCHFQQGRPQEAILCLTRAAELNPSYIPAYVKLGILLNGQSKFMESIEWSKKGLKVAPEAASLYYNIGFAYCRVGLLKEGQEAMENAVKYMPTLAAAHAALGMIHHRAKHYRRALKHYREAFALGFDDPDARVAANHLEILAGPQLAN